MSFIQLVRILWARRGIILLSTITCFVAALLIVKLLPERYEGHSRLMLEIVKPDPVTGQVMASQFARAFVKTQQELIRDYRVAGKVVDNFGWTSSPVLAQRYAQRASDDKRDFRRWLAQIIIDNTDVKLIEGSNILEISFASASPETAAKGADAVRAAYIEQTEIFRREAASRNAQWFRDQAAKLKVDLAAAEKRKADFEQENGIILQDNNQDTEMAKLQALAATAPMAQAVAPAPVNSPSTAMLAQLDAQIASMAQTLGPNHPDLQNMRRQRAAVAEAASRELASARAAARASSPGPSIASLMSAQTQKVLAQRGKVGEAQRLAADVSVLREQYNKTVGRASELDQEAQSTETGLTLLGNAVVPENPEFPKVGLSLIGFLAFGLGLGILVSVIVELLSRRVRGAEDLAMAGVPVIGAMPRGTVAKRATIWSFLGLRNPFAKRVTE